MWPEYGGALSMLNALAADGFHVEDVDGALFERGRQLVVPHFAHVETADALAVLDRFENSADLHVDSAIHDVDSEAIVDLGWTGDYEPRRFRLVLARQRPQLPNNRAGALATPVGRISRELPPLVPGADGRYVVPESGAFAEGWGRLAGVARTLMDLGADVRPTFEGYDDLSGVLHFAGGTLVRGNLDWTDVINLFSFPQGVQTEIMADGYALIRDIPQPFDPLRATFALVLAPAHTRSLLRRIFH